MTSQQIDRKCIQRTHEKVANHVKWTLQFMKLLNEYLAAWTPTDTPPDWIPYTPTELGGIGLLVPLVFVSIPANGNNNSNSNSHSPQLSGFDFGGKAKTRKKRRLLFIKNIEYTICYMVSAYEACLELNTENITDKIAYGHVKRSK